jgi:hypothetical protein
MVRKNTFGERLGQFGFNPHSMLVVDLMHEFELGVWKDTFTHIIRLLHAAVPGGKAVEQLNARWANIPTIMRPNTHHSLNHEIPRDPNFRARYNSALCK